jgi:hypothetical protein
MNSDPTIPHPDPPSPPLQPDPPGTPAPGRPPEPVYDPVPNPPPMRDPPPQRERDPPPAPSEPIDPPLHDPAPNPPPVRDPPPQPEQSRTAAYERVSAAGERVASALLRRLFQRRAERSVGVLIMVPLTLWRCLASSPMLLEKRGHDAFWLLMAFQFRSGHALRGCAVVAVRDALPVQGRSKAG